MRVRTCKTLEEFQQAIGAIAEYGAWTFDREAAERFVRVLPLDRMHAAFEDGRAVAGAGAFPFRLSVPGGSVDCAGVTVVGVYPTHRRRGILTQMMRAQLREAHERGDPIAALWASDERIYGRYGYGLASFCGEIELPRAHGGFAEPFEPSGGAVRYVEPEDVRRLAGPIWDQVFRERPGMFARTRDWWEVRIAADPPQFRGSAGPKRFVVVDAGDGVEGYAVYRHVPSPEGGIDAGRMRVIELMARTLRAERELWRYLLDMEWASAVTARLLPLDHPLSLILAEPRRMRMRVGDALWVRLVEVGAALSARSYTAPGRVVVEVRDRLCRWNSGRWRIEEGEARRTTRTADLACDVSALGSVYLGGLTWGRLVRGGRVDELRRGAAARADAMFATPLLPWCPEIF